MKLKNNFKTEDKLRVWVDHPYCALCGRNGGCSVHHIDGRVSSSIYNGVMLCHACHTLADGHNTQSQRSAAFRRKLRGVAYMMVLKSDHKNTRIDEHYIDQYLVRRK